ncbi:MAG: 4Fe-4S binding protein [Armatimonadetes bacterium]|nr:4Fe-4S binding protein [Armatimonadota bacterium]
MTKRFGIGAMWQDLARSLMSKPNTVLYPIERLEPPERFRGRLILDTSTCVLCGLCARDCPANVITVVRNRVEREDGTKELVGHLEFEMDRCIFCGQCAESCNSNSITFTNEFEFAQTDRQLFSVRQVEPDHADQCDLPDEEREGAEPEE